MTGISFTVELSDADLRQRLAELVGRMDRPIGFYKRVGSYLVDIAVPRNFDDQTAPGGAPWAPLKAATIRARQRKGHTPITILNATKHLASNMSARVEADGVRVGSPVEYAAIHQLGGTIDKPARPAKVYRFKDPETGRVHRPFVSRDSANHVTDVTIPAHQVVMPARPYLGLSAADEIEIVRVAEDWLGEETA
jgi:phage virion morphogenesis protein